MNEKEFISLIKDYFENAKEKFSPLAESPDPEDNPDEEKTLMSYYKAWLLLILNMIDIITEDNVKVNSTEYLAYYALIRDESPPFGPADITVHEILGQFTHEELESIFGTNFLMKYINMDIALTGGS